jgi:cytochrome c biogenesis protein CcdA
VRPEELGSRVDVRVVARSVVFVATFSLVFILFGLGATAIGSFLFDNQPLLNKVAGGLIVAMGCSSSRRCSSSVSTRLPS